MALRMVWGDPRRRPCPLARHSQVRGCREEGREQCGRLFRRPSAWSPDPAFHAPRPNRRGPARRGKSPLIWCWREGGKVILRCLRRWVIGPRGLARVRAQRRLPSLGGAAARALESRRPGSDMGRGGGAAEEGRRAGRGENILFDAIRKLSKSEARLRLRGARDSAVSLSREPFARARGGAGVICTVSGRRIP